MSYSYDIIGISYNNRTKSHFIASYKVANYIIVWQKLCSYKEENLYKTFTGIAFCTYTQNLLSSEPEAIEDTSIANYIMAYSGYNMEKLQSYMHGVTVKMVGFSSPYPPCSDTHGYQLVN